MGKRVRRIEKDPNGGWIVRTKPGEPFFDKEWRWNSRSVARSVVRQLDMPVIQPPAPADREGGR